METLSSSISTAMKIQDEVYLSSFMRNLFTLSKDRVLTDITLTAGEHAIHCHKAVLAAACPYFYAMFTSGLEESSAASIEIKCIKAATLTTLVTYMYTAEAEVTVDNVQNLVQACELFQLESLKGACEDFMVMQVDPSNCLGFYRFSRHYGLSILERKSKYCMLHHFVEVARISREFLNLSEAEVIKYISDDTLDVKHEDCVFQAVLSWVTHMPADRNDAFHRLIGHVRLPFCTTVFLCHVVCQEERMRSDYCRGLLEEAQCFHMLTDYRHKTVSPRTIPRLTANDQSHLVIIGGLTKDERENRFCWYLDERRETWEQFVQLPRPNWKFYSACAVPQGVFITGGYNGNVKRECWFFNVWDKKWVTMPPMIDARCKHRSVLHGDFLYVIGGEDDKDLPLAEVELFNLKSRNWTKAPPMSKALSDAMVVSFGHKIYVFSGIEEDDTSSSCCLEYDPVWQIWKAKTDMPEACRLGAAVALNEHIYVVGGYTRTCFRYSPADDTWTVLTGPRERHGNAPAVLWRGKVLVVGGDVEMNKTTSVVEEYDPGDDVWSLWNASLREELSCHSLVVLDLAGLV